MTVHGDALPALGPGDTNLIFYLHYIFSIEGELMVRRKNQNNKAGSPAPGGEKNDPTKISQKIDRKRELVGVIVGTVLVIVLFSIICFVAPSVWRGAMIATTGVFLVVALPIRVFVIYYPDRDRLIRGKERISEIYSTLSVHQKLYISTCIVTLTGMFLIFAGGMPFAAVYFSFMLAFYAYVATYDVLRWYKAVSENLVGKAAIGVVFAAASNFAYSLAGQQIADVVHVVPTNFPRTTLFIAIATIPFIMVFIAGMVALVAILMPIVFMVPLFLEGSFQRVVEWLLAGTIRKSTARYVAVTFLFQIIFYGAIGGFVYSMGKRNIPWYAEKMSHATAWLIYNFDMYNGRECKLVGASKLAPLGDAKFLIAHQSPGGDFVFDSPVKCDDLPAPQEVKK